MDLTLHADYSLRVLLNLAEHSDRHDGESCRPTPAGLFPSANCAAFWEMRWSPSFGCSMARRLPTSPVWVVDNGSRISFLLVR